MTNDTDDIYRKPFAPDLIGSEISAIYLVWSYVQLVAQEKHLSIYPDIMIDLGEGQTRLDEIPLGVLRRELIGRTVTSFAIGPRTCVIEVGNAKLVIETGRSVGGETFGYSNRETGASDDL